MPIVHNANKFVDECEEKKLNDEPNQWISDTRTEGNGQIRHAVLWSTVA